MFIKFFTHLYIIVSSINVCSVISHKLDFIFMYLLLFFLLVKVKWGKELFNNVEVNTDEDPILFKAQLFALTGVQPERQKVMLKGTTLKDDSWGNIKLSDVKLLV